MIDQVASILDKPTSLVAMIHESPVVESVVVMDPMMLEPSIMSNIKIKPMIYLDLTLVTPMVVSTTPALP